MTPGPLPPLSFARRVAWQRDLEHLEHLLATVAALEATPTLEEEPGR